MKEKFCLNTGKKKKWGMILVIAASCCLVAICVIGICRIRKHKKRKRDFVDQSDVTQNENDAMREGLSHSPEWERNIESNNEA